MKFVIWVPDTHARGFAAEAHRQSVLAATSAFAEADQEFVDARRGELWTVSGGRDYAGKPRQVLVVQNDVFDGTDSITVCPLTSDPTRIPLLRIPLMPKDINGLAAPSSIMLDKVTTMPRAKLGDRIGQVSATEIVALA